MLVRGVQSCMWHFPSWRWWGSRGMELHTSLWWSSVRLRWAWASQCESDPLQRLRDLPEGLKTKRVRGSDHSSWKKVWLVIITESLLLPSNESPSDTYSTSSSLQHRFSALHSSLRHRTFALREAAVSPDQRDVVYEAAVPGVNTRGSYSQLGAGRGQ